MSQKTQLIVLRVLTSLSIIAVIIMGIWGNNTLKKYNQTTSDLTVAQSSITTLNNQLAVKNSDIIGLREEKLNLESQLAATEQLLNQTRLRLKAILSKYENTLTRVENLKNLRDKYHSYKLELDISEARFSEKIQKCNKEKAQLQKENEQLRLSIAAPIQKE